MSQTDDLTHEIIKVRVRRAVVVVINISVILLVELVRQNSSKMAFYKYF